MFYNTATEAANVYRKNGTEINKGMYRSDATATSSLSSRFLPTLSGTQYGTLDTAINIDSGEVEVVASTTTTNLNIVLIDSDSSGINRGYLWIDATGAISWNTAVYSGFTIDGVAATDGVTPFPNDGKVHTFKGIISSTANFGIIGCRFNILNFFVGEILSVKFTDSGTVVANYVFDSGSDLYQLARGTSVGGENLTTNITTTWDGTEADFSTVDLGFVPDSSKSYLIDINITSYTSGKIKLNTAGTDTPYVVNDYTSIITGLLTSCGAQTSSGVDKFIGTVVFSLKEMPDTICELINFATTDWSRYTLQRNINHDAGSVALGWAGDNLVTNGTFDADTDWTKGAGHTISDGVLVSSSAYSITKQDVGATDGNSYLIEETLSGSLTNFAIGIGSTYASVQTSIGNYIDIVIADGDLDLKLANSSLGDFTVDNVSVKHLLEVA